MSNVDASYVCMVVGLNQCRKLFQSLGALAAKLRGPKVTVRLPELVDHQQQPSETDGDWQWL